MPVMATVSDVQVLVRELSDKDFREVMYWTVSTEKKRRESQKVVDASRVQMVREARVADPSVAPEVGEDGVLVWREPANVLCAYLPRERVKHADCEWGLSGDAPSVAEPGMCPEWVPVDERADEAVEEPAEVPVDAPEADTEPEVQEPADTPVDEQETTETN